MKPPPTISDHLGAKLTCSVVMRMVCLAWLAPATSLVWIGFASIGIRTASKRELDLALDRVQAMAVLLAIFGCLIGLVWALRTIEYLPSPARIGAESRLFRPAGHAVALATGLVILLFASLTEVTDPAGRSGTTLLAVAAGLGCHGLSFVTRWLLRAPLDPSLPLALLSLGAAFQVTVGWLHVLHPTGILAPLLVIEGLVMAWTSVAAARVVMAAERTVDVAAEETLELISQAPAQQSLPEPAVGR
ncbi:MAG: hypothetical protein ACR2QK_01600 [Acidimicrobiales bacterium]